MWAYDLCRCFLQLAAWTAAARLSFQCGTVAFPEPFRAEPTKALASLSRLQLIFPKQMAVNQLGTCFSAPPIHKTARDKQNKSDVQPSGFIHTVAHLALVSLLIWHFEPKQLWDLNTNFSWVMHRPAWQRRCSSTLSWCSQQQCLVFPGEWFPWTQASATW